MGRKCSAKQIKGFSLKDDQIGQIYLSKINYWKNGGAYVPIPADLKRCKVYVVVRK